VRKIYQLLFKDKRVSAEGKPYTLYLYQLDDGSEVETVRKYDCGERVEVYYDKHWDKIKLKKYSGA
jgi:hypothetical protein